MEFRTIKEDGQVKKIKNHALSVMQACYSEEEVVTITTHQKNTTKPRITALPSLLGNVVKSNASDDGRPSGTAGVPLGVLENHNLAMSVWS